MNRIPGEIFKTAGPMALAIFHIILTSIWEEKNSDFSDATIVLLYKNKGSKAYHGNYSLISCGKDFG